MFDWTKPTTQIIGTFQKWTPEYLEAIQKEVEKNGQFVLVVTKIDDPVVDIDTVCLNISEILKEHEILLDLHYQIIHMPNIVRIVEEKNIIKKTKAKSTN